MHRLWMDVLAREARQAIRDGDLPRGTDPYDIAFTMNAIAMGVNQARHLVGRRRRARARLACDAHAAGRAAGAPEVRLRRRAA